jgi:hypothetical protein
LLKRSILVIALVFMAAFAAGGSRHAAAEEASPPLHFQAAAISDTAARFSWTPGAGNEWFCVDLASTPDDLESLSGTWFNSGCGTTLAKHLVKGLQCGSIYYTRVWASTGEGGVYSPPLRVDMNDCASTITAPTNLRPLFETAHTVRLAWDAGDNNNWYCVEMALDLSELIQQRDSWTSLGCGMTETELTVEDLECETHYHWRVVAWNFRVETASDVRTVLTADCDGRLRRARVESVAVSRNNGSYSLDVVVALPNACLAPGSYEVEQQANLIEVVVRNIYIEPLTTCADIQGTHIWTISLLGDFAEGQTYIIVVNDDHFAYFAYTPPPETY